MKKAVDAMRIAVLVTCLLFAWQAVSFSDIIELKDGTVIKGLIVKETEDSIKLKGSIAVFTLLKGDIERVRRGTSEENEELIKQWNERKRKPEVETKRALQEEKAKTTATETKGISGGKTQGAQEKRTDKKEHKPPKPSYEHGLDSINTRNYANRNLQYYYYIPGTIVENKNKSYPLLIVIPGLSGQGDLFVTPTYKKFAYENKFVIISPSFAWDEKNWASQKSYQYPNVWSGNALLKIINKFKKDHNIRISKFHLFGFSAGAQFALRFALWKPKLCAACAAHGSGGRIIPKKKAGVKFLVTCGTRDASRNEYAKEFRNAAKRYRIDVTYKTYDIGHTLSSAQIEDSLKFFKNSL